MDINDYFPNLGYGLGLRSKHYNDVLGKWPKSIDWFEVVSENFIYSDAKPKRILTEIRERYPIVMHGVSMSIGSTDPLDINYLKHLKNCMEWLKPAWVSDHLCWSGVDQLNSHDLLPVPYSEESLKHIITRIKRVQDILERPVLFENPSTYMEFTSSSILEYDFLKEMVMESGSGILLDMNNVYVTCYNHKLDPKKYLDTIPGDRVFQIHLAGHCNNGSYIIDTHDDFVIDEVWDLYFYFIKKNGFKPTMVEWDDKIPEFSVLVAEIDKARIQSREIDIIGNMLPEESEVEDYKYNELGNSYKFVQDAIISQKIDEEELRKQVRRKENFSESEQLDVYVSGYRYRLFDVIYHDYPNFIKYVGEGRASKVISSYIENVPSVHRNISFYSTGFADYVQANKSELKIEDEVCELICLESVQLQLFDKVETTSVVRSDFFEALEVGEFLLLKLQQCDVSEVLVLNYDVNKYLETQSGAIERRRNFLMLCRVDEEVCCEELSEFEYKLLNLLDGSRDVSVAIENLSQEMPDYKEELFMKGMQIAFAKFCGNNILCHSA